jgi:predicted ABC-type ATPase
MMRDAKANGFEIARCYAALNDVETNVGHVALRPLTAAAILSPK